MSEKITTESTEVKKKLRPKYIVVKIGPDGKPMIPGWKSTDPEDPRSPFVLMPAKDPAAFQALLVYAQCCEQDLSDEIKDWLYMIAEEPPELGTQGLRNRKSMLGRAINLS